MEWWFVTRKYPPAIGGMERLSWELTRRLSMDRQLTVDANDDGASLPQFIGAAALRLARACRERRVHLVHLGDPVLAPLARIARHYDVPVAVTLHGLDIVYPGAAYRAWRKLFLRGFDAYICISEAARAAAIDAGLPEDRLHVIGLGVDMPASAARPPLRERDTVLFIGRLVRRKGLAWFVEHVLPPLARARPALRLVIVGDGPERDAIAAAARREGVENALVWSDRDDAHKADWLARASVCVMPNIAVRGDMEGFGIVALEAAAAGCPVAAADLEGLRDALAGGRCGTPVPAGDAVAWAACVEAILRDPDAARRRADAARAFVDAHRGWDAMVGSYRRLFDALAARAGPP